MTGFQNYSNHITPTVGEYWVSLVVHERVRLVDALILKAGEDELFNFEIIDCKNDGQIIVRIKSPMSPASRGMWLLKLESMLKDNIDDGVTVWAESLGDKNSLRNLRGIKVKS